jgi:predicted RNase H-like HicB family nuclease
VWGPCAERLLEELFFCDILGSMKKSILSKKGGQRFREFNAVVEKDAEGYYVASVLELPGCHTQAKTMDTMMKRLREAIEVYLEVQKDEPQPSDFVGVYRISL